MLASSTGGCTGPVDPEVTHRDPYRARARFEPHSFSVSSALMFVQEHLVAWSMHDKIPVAGTVLSVLAENAQIHTGGGFDVRLEGGDDEILIAVSDSGSAPALRRERPRGSCLAGLDIVAALCQSWGSTPTATGKTVWARIGPGGASGGVVEDQSQRIPLA